MSRAVIERDGALLAPAPGMVVLTVRDGALVQPGDAIGTIEVLGAVSPLLVVRASGHARVVASPTMRRAVGYGDVLLTLEGAAETAAREASSTEHAMVFRAPTAGRFYSRPSPGQPRFVEPGSVVETGQPLCLIEVMKTFHRIAYAGVGLPPRARLREYLVADDADVAQGAPVATFEAE